MAGQIAQELGQVDLAAAADSYREALKAARETRQGSYYAESSREVERVANEQLAGLAQPNR